MAGDAARAGYPGAGRLGALTPAEIEWEMTAFAARRRLEMERIDDLAWLTGRYAAIGVNAPRKYPRRPDGVRRRMDEMPPEAMKAVFVNMAEGKERYNPSVSPLASHLPLHRGGKAVDEREVL